MPDDNESGLAVVGHDSCCILRGAKYMMYIHHLGQNTKIEQHNNVTHCNCGKAFCAIKIIFYLAKRNILYYFFAVAISSIINGDKKICN